MHVWGHACVAVAFCRKLNIIKILFLYIKYMYIRMSVFNFVYSRDLGAQLWTILDDEL